jgi:hypothetical protein
VSDAAVVIRGTFTGWDYVRDADGDPVERAADWPANPQRERRARARPIELTVRVTSVFKGDVPGHVVIADSRYDRYLRAEGALPFGYWAWPEEAGVCFGLDSDPTGHDALAILQPADVPGQYRLVVRPRPYSVAAARELAERYPALASPRPPAAGDSPPQSTEPAGNDWMFLSAIGAGFLLLTLVVLLCASEVERNVPPSRKRRR